MKRCEKKGCGSYAFNLRRDGIDQGELCDFHYWAARAMRFASALVDVMDCTLDHDFDKITEALKDARLMLNLDKIYECIPANGDAVCAGNANLTVSDKWLHQFAENVAYKEREACALHVEQYGRIAGLQGACKAMADGIRMRSNVRIQGCDAAFGEAPLE